VDAQPASIKARPSPRRHGCLYSVQLQLTLAGQWATGVDAARASPLLVAVTLDQALESCCSSSQVHQPDLAAKNPLQDFNS